MTTVRAPIVWRTATIREVVESGARVTVAVDSDAVLRAAVEGGVREVLIDVNVVCCGTTSRNW